MDELANGVQKVERLENLWEEKGFWRNCCDKRGANLVVVVVVTFVPSAFGFN